MGQTAVYTLGIPYIDDNVASRESPLYFGKNTDSSPCLPFLLYLRERGGERNRVRESFCFRVWTRKSVSLGAEGDYSKIFHFDYFDSSLRYRRAERSMLRREFAYSRDTLSPYFVAAITIGVRILGPALGFILGSLCTMIYADLSANPQITPTDPRWVGAWWLGKLKFLLLITPSCINSNTIAQFYTILPSFLPFLSLSSKFLKISRTRLEECWMFQVWC